MPDLTSKSKTAAKNDSGVRYEFPMPVVESREEEEATNQKKDEENKSSLPLADLMAQLKNL